MRTVALAVMLFVAAPAYAQTEVAITTTAAYSNVADVLTYRLGGISVEAARYVGKFAVTAEVGFSVGSGEFPQFAQYGECFDGPNHWCRDRREGEPGLPTKITYSMKTFLAGVRYRFPGRITPSVRVASGIAVLTGDERRQGLPVLTSDLFTVTVGGAVDVRVSQDVSVRSQFDAIYLRGFGDWAQYRVSVGGVFAW